MSYLLLIPSSGMVLDNLFFSSRIFIGFYIRMSVSFLKNPYNSLLIISIFSYKFCNIFKIVIPCLIPNWGAFHKLLDDALQDQDDEKKDWGTVPGQRRLRNVTTKRNMWPCPFPVSAVHTPGLTKSLPTPAHNSGQESQPLYPITCHRESHFHQQCHWAWLHPLLQI